MPVEIHPLGPAKARGTAAARFSGGSKVIGNTPGRPAAALPEQRPRPADLRIISGQHLEALRVDAVTTFDPEDVLPLLAEYPHKPFSRSYMRSEQKSAEWMLTDSLQLDAILLQAKRGPRVVGVAALSALPWESEIFGFRMGTVRLIAASGDRTASADTYRLLLERLTSFAAARGFRHVSCRVPAGEMPLVHAVQESGFLLADTTLEYSWRTRSLPDLAPPASLEIRRVKKDDLTALTALAREAFADRTSTRFLNDPHLPRDRVGELYVDWTRRSCEGTFADITMVALHADVPVGFLTCKVEREVSRFFGRTLATIGIGAVRPDHEGRGLFAALGRAVLQWCARNDVEFVRSRIMVQHVASSWNALRTGARQTDAFHMFHRWIDQRHEAGDHE